MKHLHCLRAPRAPQGFSVLELLVVVSLLGIVAAIALPMAQPALKAYEIGGRAHAVAYDVSLAKMQAASGFTKARLYVDLAANSFHVETWNQATNTWTTPGGVTQLASGMGFGYGTLSTPPPDTQGTIGQASACLDASGAVVANTSCVLFNSRGAPIDGTGTPIATNAVYLTDGQVVYGVAVSLAGLTQLWWTPTWRTAWQKQ